MFWLQKDVHSVDTSCWGGGRGHCTMYPSAKHFATVGSNDAFDVGK